MNYGLRLKLQREKCGLTQEEAATKIEISRSSLSLYENNKQIIPLTVILKLTYLYKCDIFDIMGVHDTDMEKEVEFDVKAYYLLKAHARYVVESEKETDEKFGNIYSDEYYRERFRSIISDMVNNPIYASNFEGIAELEKADDDFTIY